MVTIAELQINAFVHKLTNSQSDLLLVQDDAEICKPSFTKLLAAKLGDIASSSAVVYFSAKKEAGRIPLLLELESHILSSLNTDSGKTSKPPYPYLATNIRSHFSDVRPEVIDRSISNGESVNYFLQTLTLISPLLRTQSILILIDVIDHGTAQFFLDVFKQNPHPGVRVIIASSDHDLRSSNTQVDSLELGTEVTDYHVLESIFVDKKLMDIAQGLRAKYNANLGVLEAIIRINKMFGVEHTLELIGDTTDFTTANAFLRTLFGRMYRDLGDAEQTLLIPLACSLEPLTHQQIAKSLNWEVDFLERVLSERSRITAILDHNKDGELAIFHSCLSNAVIGSAPKSQLGVVHTRIAKNYVHTNVEEYWRYPHHIGYAIYHLSHRESPDIAYYLLLNEVKTLCRLWNLSDITIPAIEQALTLIGSFKPSSISLELTSGSDRIDLSLGAQDESVAIYNLARELAYYLDLTGKKQQAEEFRNKALNTLERSDKLDDGSKSKLRGMLWGDKAQHLYEERDLSLAAEAVKSQLDAYQGVTTSTLLRASALHNLGIINREQGNWKDAIRSFEKAVDLSSAEPKLKFSELIQLADAWRSSGNSEKALKHYQEALKVAQETHDAYDRAVALGYTALVQLETRDLDSAFQNATESGKTFEMLGAISDMENARQILEEIQKLRKR